jgi:hypothetical protein
MELRFLNVVHWRQAGDALEPARERAPGEADASAQVLPGTCRRRTPRRLISFDDKQRWYAAERPRGAERRSLIAYAASVAEVSAVRLIAARIAARSKPSLGSTAVARPAEIARRPKFYLARRRALLWMPRFSET